MKNLTVTIRQVTYSTYRIPVEDDYKPEDGEQILNDFFQFGDGEWALTESDVDTEEVEDWDIG